MTKEIGLSNALFFLTGYLSFKVNVVNS